LDASSNKVFGFAAKDEAARANDEKRMSTDFMMSGKVGMNSSCRMNICREWRIAC
jgi:hypothetical protein